MARWQQPEAYFRHRPGGKGVCFSTAEVAHEPRLAVLRTPKLLLRQRPGGGAVFSLCSQREAVISTGFTSASTVKQY